MFVIHGMPAVLVCPRCKYAVASLLTEFFIERSVRICSMFLTQLGLSWANRIT